jgi:hypothetical protein
MLSELVVFKQVYLQHILVRFQKLMFLLLSFALNTESVENINWGVEVEHLLITQTNYPPFSISINEICTADF